MFTRRQKGKLQSLLETQRAKKRGGQKAFFMKTYSIPIKIIIEVGDPTEHIEFVQPPLLPKEEITVNGQGEPLPWEKPKKKKGGWPKGKKRKVAETSLAGDKPKTEGMVYTLKNKLHYLDDQIEAMSFEQARKEIGEYYKVHPKL